MKKRLDSLLVEKGFAKDYKDALALLLSGKVFVDRRRVTSAGRICDDNVNIEVKQAPLYVSRGGAKLEEALRHFNLDVSGRVCLDIGASTGGFTDCLLKKGAKKVYALDVGRNLLHEKIRQDGRVVVIENFNFKYFSESDLSLFQELPDFIVVDVSFISLKRIIGVLYNIFKYNFTVLALIKPQFELSPDKLVGGIVKNDKFFDEAVKDVVAFSRNLGFEILGTHRLSIKGAKGNTECFVYLNKVSKP